MNQQIANNIYDILDHLGIDYIENGKEIRFKCPIHGGDNYNGCIYIDDDFEPNWKCYSHNCHDGKTSLIYFLMLTLKLDYISLVEWVKKFKISPQEKSDRSFVITTHRINSKRRKVNQKIPLSELSKFNHSPDFYLQKGFSSSTLDKFNIGFCKDRKSVFYNHVIVPVLNDDGKTVAGIIGRNINPQCIICKGYHKTNDPCTKNGIKWKNSKGFFNNSYFYNFWNAKPYIEETNSVFLVESAADVWRMYESKIYNTLGIFGTSLSIDQKLILESLPIFTIYLFLDPDEAGITSCQRLKKYLDRFYTVHVINYNKQPADCSIEELRGLCGNRIS